MIDTPPPLFASTGLPQPKRRAAIEASRAHFEPGVSDEAIRRFLNKSILPPSKRWIFLSLGKNASSSTLRLLYRFEFGRRFHGKFNSPEDINPDAVIHQLANQGVFTRALRQGWSLPDLLETGAERLLIVRNPYARATSAFRYLCRSHALGAPWFLGTRLRAEARTGLNFETMSNTPEGFRRFLAHIEAEVEQSGALSLDAHWCIQAESAHLAEYDPTLVGRLEKLDAFYQDLAERLGTVLPEDIEHANRQTEGVDALIADPDARRRIERIYAVDFETFGY